MMWWQFIHKGKIKFLIYAESAEQAILILMSEDKRLNYYDIERKYQIEETDIVVLKEN